MIYIFGMSFMMLYLYSQVRAKHGLRVTEGWKAVVGPWSEEGGFWADRPQKPKAVEAGFDLFGWKPKQ